MTFKRLQQAFLAAWLLAMSALPTLGQSATKQFTINVLPGGSGNLTIPSGHPRLFWTPARLSTAQAWVTNTGYAGLNTPFTRGSLDSAVAWQYRIEANNANPGNVVSYNIYTIQLGDASGFSVLTPGVVDSIPGNPSSGTFTVTLDANNSVVINKGITSSGGTIKAAGVSNTLRTTAQIMLITDAGPVWQ